MPRVGSKTTQKKKSIQSTAQCCRWDFTLFDEISSNEVRKILQEYCKKYCFQKEKGEKTGKDHYQGRFSLKLKKRGPEVIKLFNKHWQAMHITATSNENKDNDFYVLKEETRIDGPFSDQNEMFIPKDVEEVSELRPWQKSLVDELSIYDKRTIDVVFEEFGNVGKTTLVRWMMCYKDAEEIPFCNEFRDVMRMSYDMGPKKIYFVDMPRALPKAKMEQFFAAVEKLKSGYCYDDRYGFKRRLFDRPRVCIFTNVHPDLDLLSKDMWKIWTVKDNNLIPYITPHDIESPQAPISPADVPDFYTDTSGTDDDSDSSVLTPALTNF